MDLHLSGTKIWLVIEYVTRFTIKFTNNRTVRDRVLCYLVIVSFFTVLDEFDATLQK